MRGPEVKTVAISSCIQHCVITDPKSDLNMFQIREREKLEKVIIVQYASSGLSVDLARYALLNLPLKQGDMIRQFIVVRPFDRSLRPPRLISLSTCFSNPTSNEKGGNGTKLQTSSTILKKQENIEREIIEKQHESQLNIDIQHITRLAESRQIDFDTTAEAGNSIKEFAVQAAKDFGATYVMLDRSLSKALYILINILLTIFT
ncbi:uncharacterized protein LOC143552627 [Bidens hawaiensis]|uniref:uncharacterized protein LOC143552627 n=1 Tax=Bidens hawaiensis TaxID=980011 RepID=UPI004049C9A7